MNAASILRGLEAQYAKESTPIFDQLMADVGSLFEENPWRPELLREPVAWSLSTDYRVPDDFMDIKLPIHLQTRYLERIVSSRYETRAMPIVQVP